MSDFNRSRLMSIPNTTEVVTTVISTPDTPSKESGIWTNPIHWFPRISASAPPIMDAGRNSFLSGLINSLSRKPIIKKIQKTAKSSNKLCNVIFLSPFHLLINTISCYFFFVL